MFQKNQKPRKMSTKTQTQNELAETAGKLFAGMFLYEDGASSKIQTLLNKGREFIGEKKLKELLSMTEDSQKAFICACVDCAIIGKETPETVSMIKELDSASKIFVELSVLTMTGRDPSVKDERLSKWADPLWNMRKISKKYMGLSPSKISREEVASLFKAVAISAMKILREHISKNID